MFSKIVIPIDLTERFPWTMVVPVAMNFVNSFGAELHFVHVIPDYGISMVQGHLLIQLTNSIGRMVKQKSKEIILSNLF